MTPDSLPSITSLTDRVPAPLQNRILATVTEHSEAIDTAFANSPAVSDIDRSTSPPDLPPSAYSAASEPDDSESPRPLREHLAFPSEWRTMLDLPGHSTWEEHNTGMTVEVIQQEPRQNYLVFSPPRTNGIISVGIHRSLATTYYAAQLLLEIATVREQARYRGSAPAEIARVITDADERGTDYPTERLSLPTPRDNPGTQHDLCLSER